MNEKTTKLNYKVFRSSPETFQVVSTVVYGEKDAILFDAQMCLSQAKKVVEMINSTGKELKSVYITHGHPDHYWGGNIIKEAYPDAKFWATPRTIDVINRLQDKEYKQWKPIFGDDIPDEPVIPNAIMADKFEIDGESLEIKRDNQGDVDNSSYVWIPSMELVIAGDIVYENVPLWVMETNKEERAHWMKTLDQIQALKPMIIIGGHGEQNAKNSPEAIKFVKEYLQFYDQAVAEAKDGEDLKARIRKRFPELNGLDIILDLTAESAFPKKA